MELERYFLKVQQTMDQVVQTQKEKMKAAANCCVQAMLENKPLFFFGTGHSHMLAEEAFYRAGGLKQVTPILETALMLHEGAAKSTRMERLGGYASVLLEEYGVNKEDLIFIFSNSGLNAVPVEMALGAKERGATVIAVTNVRQSMEAKPRHTSGKKLYEIADIVIDNCGPVGDAAVVLEPSKQAVGPTSTVIGAFIVNSIVVQASEEYAKHGRVPHIFVSANMEGGDDHNAQLMNETQGITLSRGVAMR